MFYSGVYKNNQQGITTIIIIEKILSSARKMYRVCNIKKITTSGSKDILVNELKKLSDDNRFIRKKKVFSQSGRPPKNTLTPPLFILASESNSEEEPLNVRESNFSIEGLLYENNDKWHKKELNPLRYGCNYYVNPEDINKTLLKAFKNNRLQINESGSFSDELKRDIQKMITVEDSDSEIIQALSLSIWFCERVRQIKRY